MSGAIVVPVLVATHDEQAWARADRVLSMRDGRLADGVHR